LNTTNELILKINSKNVITFLHYIHLFNALKYYKRAIKKINKITNKQITIECSINNL